MDGTVKSIVQDAVVFSQDVNDPLSLVKQKEIRKTLRSRRGGTRMRLQMPHVKLARPRREAARRREPGARGGLSLSAGSAPIRLLGVSAQGNNRPHRGDRTGRVRREAGPIR